MDAPHAVCSQRMTAAYTSTGAIWRGRTRNVLLLRSPTLVALPRMTAASRPPLRLTVPPAVTGPAVGSPRRLAWPGTPWTSTELLGLGLLPALLRQPQVLAEMVPLRVTAVTLAWWPLGTIGTREADLGACWQGFVEPRAGWGSWYRMPGAEATRQVP